MSDSESFSPPTVHPKLTDAELRSVLEQHALWLSSNGTCGNKLRLSEHDLSELDCRMISLRQALLGGVIFKGAKLEEADFTNAFLWNTDFQDARLAGSDFPGADLTGANLIGADLAYANLTGAVLDGADLTECKLDHARLDNVDLRKTRGFRLNQTLIRGAQFARVGSRWRAFVRNRCLPQFRQWCERRGWSRLAQYLRFPELHNDPWSVLRQSYAGPRLFFLFLFVLVFALPYVGRAAFYSAVGPVERRLAAQAESRKPELEARLATNPADLLARRELEQINSTLAKVEPRPLWHVLLKWDEGKVWPTVLAVLLILYNAGLYLLISSVSPLRDEEERSGWSPAWKDYSKLIWLHRAVTGLFYVSFVSFVVNAERLLTDTVFVVKPG